MPRVPVAFSLDTAEWKTTRYPGISIRFLRTDKLTGDATVLIRMDAGCGYPQHRHVRDEEILVLAGGYHDHRGTWRTGDYVLNPAGSVHHPVALDGGPCILFAIAHGGIETIEPGRTPDASPPAAEPRFERLIERWGENPRVHEWHAWWVRRTEELRRDFPWLHDRRKLARVTGKDFRAFLEAETAKKTMRWPLGLFSTRLRRVAATPELAEKLDRLLWADTPLEARIDGALTGEHAFHGIGRSVTLPALLLQTLHPERIVGLLSMKFTEQAFPIGMPPGTTPGERFAIYSRAILASWHTARPDRPLNLAHWVLWMEYAAHRTVRAAIFRA
ncbi:MAG: cupin domain-containing protein [Candidatus Brocadiae bacterium]|nr:cupin domain-containing protein [Candidatus Brocadiia bacterium]